MDTKTLHLHINGMHCAACSARCQRILERMPEVTEASVNLATGAAAAHLAPDADADAALTTAIARINAQGFTATAASPAGDDPADWAENDAQTKAETDALRGRLLRMVTCALPLLFLSMGHMLGMPLPVWLAPHNAPVAFVLAQLALTLPVVWWGVPLYRSGLQGLWRQTPNMDSLVAVGTGASLLYSLWQTGAVLLTHDATRRTALAMDVYFESCAVLLTMITLGKFMELSSRRKAGDAMGALLRLVPPVALRLDADGRPQEVPVSALAAGDAVLVRAGARVPVDGVVTDGRSAVDMSLITGESMPVPVAAGDELTGGSVNTEGVLTLRVTRVGADTTLARMVRLVREAQSARAPIARLADTVSFYFVPTVMALALLAALGWLAAGEDVAFALRIFVAVLVIACPCAMGLATPTSIMVASGRGAQLGVLIKNGAALEQAARVTTLALDKTGTLTSGVVRVQRIIPTASLSETALLTLALSLETRSEHPLAQALLTAGREAGLTALPVADVRVLPGLGIDGNATRDGTIVHVALGNAALMQQEGVATAAHSAALERISAQGQSPLLLAVDGTLTGIFALADSLRPESADAVARLHDMGIKLVMLSGDNARTARVIADAAGIHEVTAEVLPQQKEAAIAALQAQGRVVGMVGDGINDAPALARADVGLVVGSGVDVSMEAGDIILMRGGMDALVTALRLARATLCNIRQNLFWAFGYNVLGIPVAAGLLHAFGGPTLSPMLAGTAMALSSTSVVCNALRLRHFTGAVKTTR